MAELRDKHTTRRSDKLTGVTLALVLTSIGLGYSIYRDLRQEVLERIDYCEQHVMGNRSSLEQHRLKPSHETQHERFKFLKERVDACCPYRERQK